MSPESRADGEFEIDGLLHALPFQSHVSLCGVWPSEPPAPPKRTTEAPSVAIIADCRAGGGATTCELQSLPSHVHVSESWLVPSVPPKRTMVDPSVAIEW